MTAHDPLSRKKLPGVQTLTNRLKGDIVIETFIVRVYIYCHLYAVETLAILNNEVLGEHLEDPNPDVFEQHLISLPLFVLRGAHLTEAPLETALGSDDRVQA